MWRSTFKMVKDFASRAGQHDTKGMVWAMYNGLASRKAWRYAIAGGRYFNANWGHRLVRMRESLLEYNGLIESLYVTSFPQQ